MSALREVLESYHGFFQIRVDDATAFRLELHTVGEDCLRVIN